MIATMLLCTWWGKGGIRWCPLHSAKLPCTDLQARNCLIRADMMFAPARMAYSMCLAEGDELILSKVQPIKLG